MKKDLGKQELYDGVKAIVEAESDHIHLTQHKLFTLFSIAFQYMLFRSTKKPGAYIIRVEDSLLAEKLARKSKDPSTRRFVQSVLLPRKLKFQKSTFYIDFFHIGSWNLTSEIPKDKVQGAIIVKNTSSKPMMELAAPLEGEEGAEEDIMASLPADYYFTSLRDFVPSSITIAYETELEGVEPLTFDFIQKEKERTASGVTVNSNIDLENIKD
ncbi:MAG: hypothetical protein ACJAT2_002643 [Bacteriovoracaceae bacterium]|jgi:hypothetical protein